MNYDSFLTANPAVFTTIFQRNWENVRHVKNERIWFTNIFSMISAGTGKLQAMVAQAQVGGFVALGQSEGGLSRYPKFRWIFPVFYSVTTAGFVALLAYQLLTGDFVG